MRTQFAIIFFALLLNIKAFAQIKALVPELFPQDEEALLHQAKKQDPEILTGGYRQYDLIVARLNTWDNELKNIIVRLLLPPEKKRDHFPLVVYVHGGGFIGGSPQINILEERKGFGFALRTLLDEGFAVASVGYRLAREAGWPAPLSDVLCGFRFLSLHAHNWGIDASHIGITGHSAGARIAALAATVDQNAFHRQGLPWGNSPVNFAAIWLWAGSAWDWPNVNQWSEFGKPRYFSVPRLLFGEHPAWDNDARHRIRIRSHLPHLSMAIPPLYIFRGESDYRGDHSDARRAVEIWRILGSEATLGMEPGGHNTIGPTEPFIAFFKQHLCNKNPKQKPRNLLETARRLNDAEEALAAIEVLNQKNTRNGGYSLPKGSWMILQDHALLWNPDEKNWTKEEQKQLNLARKKLAEKEAKAATRFLQRGHWFRAETAAKNVLILDSQNEKMISLISDTKEIIRKEEQVFLGLHKANRAILAGDVKRAKEIITIIDDSRLTRAYEGVSLKENPQIPIWAEEGGIDLYGIWISIKLKNEVKIRFRWVEPGSRELPEHLHFRNKEENPWTTRIIVNKGFWLAETETTSLQWQAISDQHPKNSESADINQPQTMVDYLQIINWLKLFEKRLNGPVIRLPTEEEWLYAATNGGCNNTQPPVHIGAVHAMRVDVITPAPLPVEATIPDLNGYYGLLGGVMEWTASPGPSKAYFKDKNGRKRIMAYPISRGGAWSFMPHSLALAERKQQRHGNKQPDLGFRIAIEGSD